MADGRRDPTKGVAAARQADGGAALLPAVRCGRYVRKKAGRAPGSHYDSYERVRYTAWMLLACLPLGPVVTSNETFCPSLSVLKPCMLIAEKCANRSSPPPSGVINPKPFASLNHFTVPVAIVGNSLSTRIKRDVARPMFRSQGKYGGRTT